MRIKEGAALEGSAVPHHVVSNRLRGHSEEAASARAAHPLFWGLGTVASQDGTRVPACSRLDLLHVQRPVAVDPFLRRRRSPCLERFSSGGGREVSCCQYRHIPFASPAHLVRPRDVLVRGRRRRQRRRLVRRRARIRPAHYRLNFLSSKHGRCRRPVLQRRPRPLRNELSPC